MTSEQADRRGSAGLRRVKRALKIGRVPSPAGATTTMVPVQSVGKFKHVHWCEVCGLRRKDCRCDG